MYWKDLFYVSPFTQMLKMVAKGVKKNTQLWVQLYERLAFQIVFNCVETLPNICQIVIDASIDPGCLSASVIYEV